MRVEVPTRETKSKGHEAVEFPYNIHEDAPETVVEEMVRVQYMCMIVAKL